MRVRAVAALLLALCALPVHAWTRGGHRATAVIAYRTLAASHPDVVARVLAIMRAHPAAADFERRMDEEGADPRAREERLFSEIAQWPDEARRGPYESWHRGSWHTVDLPWVRPNGGYTGEPPAPVEENLLWAWRRNAALARDPAADATERAVALSWVFHLAGDVHQPLHAITLFDAAFPQGDRHGGRFRVQGEVGARPQSLHAFWDGVVLRSAAMSNVRSAANTLMLSFPAARLPELAQRPYAGADDFERWAREESHALAVSRAYGPLPAPASSDVLTSVDEPYVSSSRALAARRMALSGYRLAAVLEVLLGAASSSDR